MKLSILIPVYNEQATITRLLEKVHNVNLNKIGVSKEIIIVDDGSKDRTVEIIKDLQKKYKNIRFIQHEKNKGKGGAIKTAIKYATGDILIVQDADLEYDPQDYFKCILPIINKKAKVVYGSRRLEKRNKKYSGLSYYIGGVGITWLFNLLFFTRLTDEPTCYKTFRSDVIKKIKINSNGFSWEPEVTAKIVKSGIKIYEVPVRYYPRSVKEGKKINWKDGLNAIWTIIKYRFVN